MDKDEKKYHREYMKKYYHRPDVKAKMKKYREKTEVKERMKEYDKAYSKKPEVILRAKERRETPEIKARIKKYYKKPETIKRMKEYYQTPKARLKQKEYYHRPEIKERIKTQHKEYLKNKRLNDPSHILRTRLIKRSNKFIRAKGKSSKDYNINYDAILQHLKPFPQNLDLHVIHHKIPLNRFKFFNPDGTIIKEDFEKAFAPDNHEWMLVEEHRKLDHSKL